MKLTYLIDSLSGGGKERQLLYLLTELATEHQIQVIVFNQDVFYTDIFELPVNLVLLSKKTRYTSATIKKVYLELCHFHPQIIHTMDNISHLIALPYILYKKPKVVDGSIRYAGKIKKTIFARLIQKLIFTTSDIIVSNSMQGLKIEKLINSKKAIAIHNGFDIVAFLNNSNKAIKEKRTELFKFHLSVVMTGRFFSAKDYITFIKGAKLALAKKQDIGFYCIGDGPNRKAAEIEALGWINTNIFFLGQRTDVFSLLPNFDVGVLLSNTNGHAEGISNAIMEYMATGLPVIATNAGGTPEIICNKFSGFLINAFDQYDLAEKIIFLYENKHTRLQMGINGRNIIEKSFSIRKMKNMYLNQYENLLS